MIFTGRVQKLLVELNEAVMDERKCVSNLFDEVVKLHREIDKLKADLHNRETAYKVLEAQYARLVRDSGNNSPYGID